MHYNDCPTFHWDFLSDAQNRREDNGIDDRFQLERIDDTTLGAWHFPTSNSIWSEHGINDPLCQNWALSAFVLTDLSWNEPLPALESDCWCRFAQQKNLFLPTPSLTAFAQISRGPLFVQISGKYLEGFCLWFPLHRLLHLMKFDPRTMLSNC